MTKLRKMYYVTSKGEKKVNCYTITIPKVIVNETDLDNNNLKIHTKDNKIIIEKEK